jgi:hypothetical protein
MNDNTLMYNFVQTFSDKYKIDSIYLISHYFSGVPPKNVDDLISKLAEEYNLERPTLLHLYEVSKIQHEYRERIYNGWYDSLF